MIIHSFVSHTLLLRHLLIIWLSHENSHQSAFILSITWDLRFTQQGLFLLSCGMWLHSLKDGNECFKGSVFCVEDKGGKSLWSGTTYQTTWCHIPLYSNLSIQNYWGFGLRPSSSILKTREHCFGIWICFCPQVRGWKQIQIPECCALYILEYWTMGKVQNSNNSKRHIPLSEPSESMSHLSLYTTWAILAQLQWSKCDLD
jgi:hypothetical protein